MSYSITYSLVTKVYFEIDVVRLLEFLLQILEAIQMVLEFLLFLARGWRDGF